MEVEPRAKRAAAPGNLAEPKAPCGPRLGHARAGPGRGHVYEPARSLLEQLQEPPSEELLKQMEKANWFQRVQLQKQWQTARMDELQKQVNPNPNPHPHPRPNPNPNPTPQPQP